MTEPPPLPDSDDPYEVLGVARGCSEDELKRAYARLLRIHRPDRAPVEFQRLHAAFVAARDGDFEPRFEDDAPDGFAHDPDGGGDDQSDDDREHEPVDVSPMRRLDSVDLHRRVDQAFLAGDIDQAFRIVEDRDVERAAESDLYFRGLVMRVACAAAWERPKRARALASRHEADDFDDWWGLRFDDRRALLSVWSKWRRRRPEWLPRLIELSDSMLQHGLAQLVPPRAGSPRKLIKALERLDERDHRLLYILVRGIEGSLDEDEEQPDEQGMRRLQRSIGLRLWPNRLLSGCAWLFLIVLSAGIGFLFFVFRSKDAHPGLYSKVVRPTLAKALLNDGVLPDQFVYWLRGQDKPGLAFEYADLILNDLPLRAGALISKLRVRNRRASS